MFIRFCLPPLHRPGLAERCSRITLLFIAFAYIKGYYTRFRGVLSTENVKTYGKNKREWENTKNFPVKEWKFFRREVCNSYSVGSGLVGNLGAVFCIEIFPLQIQVVGTGGVSGLEVTLDMGDDTAGIVGEDIVAGVTTAQATAQETVISGGHGAVGIPSKVATCQILEIPVTTAVKVFRRAEGIAFIGIVPNIAEIAIGTVDLRDPTGGIIA